MLFWAAGVRGLFGGKFGVGFVFFGGRFSPAAGGLYSRLGCREKERYSLLCPPSEGLLEAWKEEGLKSPLIQPSRDGRKGNRLPGLPHFMREQGGGCRVERETFPDGLQLSGRRPLGEPLAQDLTLLAHAEYEKKWIVYCVRYTFLEKPLGPRRAGEMSL